MKVLPFILPFALLVGFLLLGIQIQSWLGTWIPGSVIGMVLLSIGLWTGVIRASFVEPVSEKLLDNLGLFFVCPGVEVIRYLDLVESHWLSLVVAIVGSSVVTLVVTGAVCAWGSESEIPNRPFHGMSGETTGRSE